MMRECEEQIEHIHKLKLLSLILDCEFRHVDVVWRREQIEQSSGNVFSFDCRQFVVEARASCVVATSFENVCCNDAGRQRLKSEVIRIRS